jgi:hypothetical protein
MISKKVFAKSDAKDLRAMSKATADAILANCTTTIVFAAPKIGNEYAALKLTPEEYHSLLSVEPKV